MRPENGTNRAYFDTSMRAERLQLLLHLVRNTGEVIYLRAPAGAGKTLFAHRLLDILGNDIASVWLRGGIDTDVASATVAQLGLPTGESLSWPDGILTGIGDQDLLVVVDDADQLALPAVERLAAMHAGGGRLMLLGHGGLAQATRDWDVQFVDLPPFNVEQSTAFLRSNAGEDAVHINDDLAGFLHHSAHGRPGLLLEALDEVLVRARRQTESRKHGKYNRRWGWMAGGVAALLLLGVVLFNQEPINALFEPPPTAGLEASIEQPTSIGNEPLAKATMPPLVPSAKVADVEPPESAIVAEDAEDLLSRQPAKMPPIALPELSRLPSADGQVDAVPSSPEIAPPPSDDPLDAVMRDAATAAGAGPREPAAVSDTLDGTPGGSEEAGVDGLELPAPTAPTTASSVPPEVADDQTASAPPARPSVEAVADELVEHAAPKLDAVAGAPSVAVATSVATKPPADKPAAPAGTPATPGEAPGAPVVQATPSSAVSVPAASPRRAPADVAGPAPVEDRSPRAAVMSDKATPAAPAPEIENAAGGLAWLNARQPAHYTLQLVGARDRASVSKFVRTHGVVQPYAVFERELNGRPWYSLVAGDFPSRDAAVAARARLSGTLKRVDIWPRTFASIFETLKKQ